MWDAAKKTKNVWLSIADLPQSLHGLAVDSKEYVSDAAATQMRLIPKGTLLVSFKLTLGRLAYAGRDLFSNEAIASLHDIDERRLSKRFLYWALTAFDWDKAAEGDEKVKGKTLNKAKLKLIPIPLPPLAEQQRIIAVLDEAFEGLARARAHAEANLQNARELFETHAASIFAAMNNGSSVTVSTVDELAKSIKGSIRTGPFGSQLLHSEFVNHGIAVLGIDNAVSNKFLWGKRRFITAEKYDQLKRYTVYPNDVLITIMGTCGRCAVVPDDIPVAINTKHLCCISLNQDKCLPEYLHRYFLFSPLSRAYLTSQASGSVMDGLNMGIIREMPVECPNLERQQAIVDAISDVENAARELHSKYESKLQDVDNLRQSLLERAFAGNLT